jgi:soluble lytic murein transglycosylase
MTTLQNLKSSALTFSEKAMRLRSGVGLTTAIIPAFIVVFTLTGTTQTAHAAGKLSDKQRKIRIKHAHELLGRYYKKSSVNVGESIPKINSAIYHWTRDHLPSKYRGQSGKIAQTIIDESTKHGFDPVFLMSVIEGESSWHPDKVGGVGEIGLMQLRPTTGKWISKRSGIKWKGDKSLFDPCQNIKVGAAYLSYLRDRFDDHARLYLAAYNMGQSNVDEALDKKIWPKDYPIHVMKRYVAFYETIGETLGETAGASGRSKAPAKSVVKKTLVAKKASKPAPESALGKDVFDTTSFDEDIFFDIDKLTRSEDDINDLKTELKMEATTDEGDDVTSGSVSTTPDQPGRS